MRNIILGLCAASLINCAQLASAAVVVCEATYPEHDLKSLAASAAYQGPAPERVTLARTSQEQRNKFVAQRALELYSEIKGSGNFHFREGAARDSVNSKLWEASKHQRPYGGLMISVDKFTIRKGYLPSVAVIHLLKTGEVFDCTFIRSLVELVITYDIVGPERFDRGCGKSLSLPCVIPTFAKEGIGIPEQPGQSGYFSNVDIYPYIYPHGTACGQNVFCVGLNERREPLYIGFEPFFDTPKTAAQILDKMYADTILPPPLRGDANIDSKILILVEQFRICRGVWNLMRDQAQTNMQTPFRQMLVTV